MQVGKEAEEQREKVVAEEPEELVAATSVERVWKSFEKAWEK